MVRTGHTRHIRLESEMQGSGSQYRRKGFQVHAGIHNASEKELSVVLTEFNDCSGQGHKFRGRKVTDELIFCIQLCNGSLQHVRIGESKLLRAESDDGSDAG